MRRKNRTVWMDVKIDYDVLSKAYRISFPETGDESVTVSNDPFRNDFNPKLYDRLTRLWQQENAA